MKPIVYGLFAVIMISAIGFAWMWQSVIIYPPLTKVEPYCETDAPLWSKGKPLKVLSFNVQYMASKNYVFFYDVKEGPDSTPSLEDTNWTINRVADIIRNEDPDVVLLQEINDANDSRTHYKDQTALLQHQLAESAFPCLARAHYWQTDFLLHPDIMGPVSMELVTLSKYSISSASRHQLPLMDNDVVTKHFYFQRAILETNLDGKDGDQVALLNTHFDAWGSGSDIMQRQVAKTMDVIQKLEQQGTPWILGGDLNLLPADNNVQQSQLKMRDTGNYDADTALRPMYKNYGAIPSLLNLKETDVAKWYTHFPNNPAVQAPDRTIDYIFYSTQWQLRDSYVRQKDTLDISDHLPVVGVFEL